MKGNKDMNTGNKTVITGMGMVTALGLDLESTWQGLTEGRSGVQRISLFDPEQLETQIAAQVSDALEDVAKKKISRRDRKRMTRTTRMALVAANEAIEQSGIDFEIYDKTRVAVILGVITTSYNDVERDQSSSHVVVKSMPNAPSAWITLNYGLEGPNFNVSTACASSAYAIGLGHQMIQSGTADVVIVGGVDSHIDPEYIGGFNQILAMSVNNETPESACRPFTSSRDGFVMGEGAGMMILESEKMARRRDATLFAEVAGYAMTSESTDITAPKENGEGMAKTMEMALKNAGVGHDEIDYINAHGTSTFLNDKYETMAIKTCFGDHASSIAVSSSKSMHGHTLGAAGAIEGIVTVMSIYNDMVTPTINHHDPDETLDLDYVPNQARKMSIRGALSNSFGFGGHNATIVYKKI